MGITCTLHAASDETIRAILADPPKVWLLVSPEDLEFYWQDRKAATKQTLTGWLGAIFGARSPGREADNPETHGFELLGIDAASGEGREADLDKAWHGIHYLLTGTADEGDAPLDFIIRGGAKTGQIEIGVDVPRAFTSGEVATIANALDALPEATLKARYKPDEMHSLDIYPDIWDRIEEHAENLDYLIDNTSELRTFVSACRAQKLGMIISLS